MKKSTLKALLFLPTILVLACNSGIEENDQVGDENNTQSLETPVNLPDSTPRVTGMGGIFFLCEQPGEMMKWYGENLGLAMDPYGSPFEFRNANNPDEINYLRWSPVPDTSTYFNPSDKPFMINYRVQNIEKLVEKLQSNGVQVLDEIASYEYGKFVHLLDIEGNKIELWEPIDSFFTQLGGQTTK